MEIENAFSMYKDLRHQVYGEKVNEKPINLMDAACIGAKYISKIGKLEDLDKSDEINACSIRTSVIVDEKEEEWVIMFKNETHNHPTEIEPFGGAATCLGGAIRDPLSGRAYVYQAMRVTGSGDPRRPIEETLPGKLPQIKITKGAAAGYSSYGNQIGLATGQVDEIYHEGYVAKRMEVGAVIGAAPAYNIRREKPKVGDLIILVGGRTGRDGCGGATGSSKEHTEDSIFNCGAEVQKGNPPVERNIQRLFRNPNAARMIKKCNDFGAGGVSVAIGELADSIDVNLDLILKKYEGLDGTELAISESQERMAVVVSDKDANTFLKYADSENLEAVAVAKVTDSGRFKMTWRDKTVLDLSRDFLNTNGVVQKAKVLVNSDADIKERKGFESPMEALEDINCSIKKGLSERFDSTIGRGTVLMPFGGENQLSPSMGMVCKLPTEGDSNTATIMTYGFDPYLSEISPYHGAKYAVLESITKQVAMGGDIDRIRLSFQEYFEKLGRSRESWGKPFAALLGALRVQKELEIPAIGGKDSMSGSFKDINVPPTLISFAVGFINPENAISSELKNEESLLVYIKNEKNKDGIVDFKEYKESMVAIGELGKKGKILAAATIGIGGIFIAAAKMAAGNNVGVTLNNIEGEEIYKPDYASLLIQIRKNEDVEKILGETNYIIIGKTTNDGIFKLSNNDSKESFKMSTKELGARLTGTMEDVFPIRTNEFTDKSDDAPVETISYEIRNAKGPLIKTSKPRIVIPVFPGTNCEIDSRHAFEKAGGEVETLVIRNIKESHLLESINRLEVLIRRSQIIMLPGGFSGGDEPNGSGKFITAIFRNPQIMDAVMELINNRDGLMLGI